MAERSVILNHERVRELRKQRGYTQVALANHAGVTSRPISNAENEIGIDVDSANRIATALGVSLEELLQRRVGDTLGVVDPTVLSTHEDVLDWNLRIVGSANRFLMCTGSRSRDEGYLKSIIAKLTKDTHVAHWRVLFGAPYSEILRSHLRELIALRPSTHRNHGARTLHLSVIEGVGRIRYSECFICANENNALVVQPPFCGTLGEYNSAVVFHSPTQVDGLARYIQNLHGVGRVLSSQQELEELRLDDVAENFV